jgi:MFS family permease
LKLPPEVPPYAQAVIEALQFSNPTTYAPSDGGSVEFCDRTNLSLPLGLPHALADNAQRWERVKAAYAEVANGLEDFVVLKGFSHCPDFVADPRRRAQYDLDLWLPKARIFEARDIALKLGYEPFSTADRFPVDHLPTMIRKTGWEWRGNYFDPELPLSLELHFRLWDEQTEHIKIEGLQEFWERRERRSVDGLHFTGLSKADRIAYASLHLLRHLFRGDVRPSHVYEIASFHHNAAEDDIFRHHDVSLRRIEAIVAELARVWFGCRLNAAVQEEVEQLPPLVQRWLNEYAFSPLTCLFQPNKDELWLHLSLLDSAWDKAAVVRRRLLPSPQGKKLLLARAGHHARALPGVVFGAVRWYLPNAGLSREYWQFFTAGAIYDFGLFVYFLLYNLYLLQIGFGEKFLGFVSSAMMAGSIAGSIPAALAIQRFGLRNTLLIGFIAVAALSAIRASVTVGPALIGLAFLAGVASCTWAVALSPSVAQLTTPKNKALGFSLVFSSGIGIGVLGGLVGGRLPLWMGYRKALLLGSAIALLAAWPAARLRLAAGQGPVGLRLPGPGLSRFLAAAVVWNLGTGAFNPFFTAYFARLHTGVETIGLIFSTAQMAQVAAVLMAPVVLRRLGLIRGISWMQACTGVALLLLASAVGPLFGALAYTGFMVFQYMSEPGLYTLLMDSVRTEERSAAAALNFMAASSAQAVAAAVSGAVIERVGYGTMLVIASFICILAGMLFRTLLHAAPQSSAPDTA